MKLTFLIFGLSKVMVHLFPFKHFLEKHVIIFFTKSYFILYFYLCF